MTTRLEHANLGVRDLDEMMRFLRTAFPEFTIRGEGTNQDGGRWVHFGTHETYLALNQSSRELERSFVPYQNLPGVKEHAGVAEHHQQRVATAPRERERPEVHWALIAGWGLEAHVWQLSGM